MLRRASIFLLILFPLVCTSAGAANMRGGGLYYSWSWPHALGFGMSSLEMEVTFGNNPITTDVLFFSTELFCGTPKLQNVFYFGIQSNVQGTGKGLIYSRFGTASLADCEIANPADSWSVASDTEGGFVGVRRHYEWSAKSYLLRLGTLRDDSVGRWFGFWIVDRESNIETYAGAIRFPKDGDGVYPLIMVQGFGSFIEHATAVSSPDLVPLWEVAVGRPVANGRTTAAVGASWWYALPTDAWQNSDMWADGDVIYARMGADTMRTHPASQMVYGPYSPPRRRAARH
jgi:hypothetical protein